MRKAVFEPARVPHGILGPFVVRCAQQRPDGETDVFGEVLPVGYQSGEVGIADAQNAKQNAKTLPVLLRPLAATYFLRKDLRRILRRHAVRLRI